MQRHNWRKLEREWIEGGHTNLREFAIAVKVPYKTILKYSAQYHWVKKEVEQREKIESKAAQKFIESVSDRIAKARLKHVQIGNILQDKGVRSLAKVETLDAAQAISAIRTGVDIERKGLGIDETTGGTANIQNNTFIGEITQLAVNDERARNLLVERIKERLGA